MLYKPFENIMTTFTNNLIDQAIAIAKAMKDPKWDGIRTSATWWDENELQNAFSQKRDEEDDFISVPVKGTRHPSNRQERRKATAHAKAKNAKKAERLGLKPWAEPEKSKWVDPYLKHHIDASVWKAVRDDYRPNPSKRRRQDNKVLCRDWHGEYDYINGNDVTIYSAYQWKYWEDDSSFLYFLDMWALDEENWEDLPEWSFFDEEVWEDLPDWDFDPEDEDLFD